MHFTLRALGRAFADHVQQAARRGLAIQHRARPLEHLYPLKQKRVDTGLSVAQHTIGQAQAVHEAPRVETAHHKPVVAHVGVTVLADHTRRVLQGLGQVTGTARFNLFAGHHIDSLRRGQQVGSGFGRAKAAACDHAAYRGCGGCSYPFTRHQQYPKHGAVSGAIGRNNDIHTLPLLDGLQAGATE